MNHLTSPMIVIRAEDIPPELYVLDTQNCLRIDQNDIEAVAARYPLIIIREEELTDIAGREDRLNAGGTTILSDDLRVLERRMLDLINNDRVMHPGESQRAAPLQWDEAVAHQARLHSEDMIICKYMDHINRAGLSPGDRLQNAGIAYRMCGENIAGSPTQRVEDGFSHTVQIYTGYPTIESAEAGLMNSPRHRKNILNRSFTHVGVGIACNLDGTFVITQNFIM